MDEAEQRLDSLCSRIIESDKAIRFVGISNKMGNQIISRYRAGANTIINSKRDRNVCYSVSLKDEYKERL
ncbi:MAG: hypothetical protein ACR2IS_13080 [Nitrososphaeraceae archaeon]